MADVELPVDAENAEPLVGRPAEGYPETFERVYLRNDGTTFPVEVHMTSVGVGARRLLLAIVRDVTDRKLAEKAWPERQQRSAHVVELPQGVAQQLADALDNFQAAERRQQSDPETAQKTFAEGVRLLREVMGAAQ
jgi:GAF domain-containing protein